MAKIYLESNNAGRSLLITDENGRWLYIDTDMNGYIGDVDFYPTDEDGVGLSDESFAEYLKSEIERNERIYDAEDFEDEFFNEDAEYVYKDCMTIDDIDNIVNYKNGIRKQCDDTKWWEV